LICGSDDKTRRRPGLIIGALRLKSEICNLIHRADECPAPIDESEPFACAEIFNIDNLQLPLWLLDFEEAVGVLVRGGTVQEQETQSTILKDAITRARRPHWSDAATSITVDTPVPFAAADLLRFIDEAMGRLDNPNTTAPYLRLRTRLESLRTDRRYAFLFSHGAFLTFGARLPGSRTETAMCRPSPTPHAGSRLRHSPPSVAIVGATGAVGRELLQILEQRRFGLAELRLYASPRSAGRTLPFAGRALPVAALSEISFDRIDLALFSTGSATARQWAPTAVQAGAVVIDNSSAFRMDPAVPLVAPEINAEKIATHSGIIANPNCAAVIAAMALWPIRRRNRIRRVILATYQAASGAGAAAMQELRDAALSRKRGRRAAYGVGCRDGSAPVPPSSLPARDHPACDLAVSSLHPELPRCRGAAGRAQARRLL
jgi:hypothetical protein